VRCENAKLTYTNALATPVILLSLSSCGKNKKLNISFFFLLFYLLFFFN